MLLIMKIKKRFHLCNLFFPLLMRVVENYIYIYLSIIYLLLGCD